MAPAYEHPVHARLSEEAAEQSKLRDFLLIRLGLRTDPGRPDILEKRIGDRRIKEWIAYGSIREDDGKDGEADVLTTRGFNHYHDPLRNWNEAGFDSVLNVIYWANYGSYPVSSILWATNPSQQQAVGGTTGDWSWQKAKEYYYIYLTGKDFNGVQRARTEAERNSYFADCLRSLGQVIHLLQDSSVPPHTRNDLHLFPIRRIPYIGKDFGKWVGRWTYETYASEYMSQLNYSAHYPQSILLSTPYPETEFQHLSAITGLFDRNQYNGGPLPTNNEELGLAEYCNANFLSQDTMWTYPHPSLDDTNAYTIDWLHPEQIDAEDGKIDNRIYVKKIAGEMIDHLAAADYWSFEYWSLWGLAASVPARFSLDEICWKDYTDKLIPRAVGYSAALLDYFFRGRIEISAPGRFLYSVIDGSRNPQAFNLIRAKVKNTTPGEEMGPGTLVAVAKYKKRTDYQPDLSSDPPSATSRQPDFSYSVSLPISIQSLSSETATEFVFNFSYEPIPAGITDLYLQVIFKGTLGDERDEAIAVGMKDLHEPMHVTLWNSTDRFYLNEQLYTAGEIKTNSELLAAVPPGLIIDPFNHLEFGIAFSSDGEPLVYNAYAEDLLSGSFSRIIVLADASPLYVYEGFYSVSPPTNAYVEGIIGGVVYQEDGSGNFVRVPDEIGRFRGINAHWSFVYLETYDHNAAVSAPWPPAVNPNPVPISVYP
jgi:hypothetical protein